MGVQEQQVPAAVERAIRVDLAAAFRLAVRLDLHEGVCNHFSVMLPDGKRFLLNRYGLHWSEVTASNLLALDAEGRILEGEGEFEKTAFYIHSRIHLANPRATCVLHTHMPYATSLTLLEGGRLEMVEQNALRFCDDIAYDDVYNGLSWTRPGDRLARWARSASCSSRITASSWSGQRSRRRSTRCTTSSALAGCRCSRAPWAAAETREA
jgi:ribulose-5-phosphate 4-epimerase/fuculose-1-phosphate aldolase